MPLNMAAAVAVRTRFAAAAGLSLVETLAEVVYPVADADVPRETSTLADGAAITGPTENGSGVGATLSYGREDDANPKTGQPSASYSIEVHENIARKHPSGRSKWLENAGTQTAPRFGEEVAKRMRPRL